ncbi:MAG: 50S ribosomal protein L1 [Patescibacteria group bacterium]
MRKSKKVAPKKLRITQQILEEGRLYPLNEAIELVKSTSYSKFDGTVEAHFNLQIDVKAPEQNIRTTVSLPHGTGKAVKIAAFSSGSVNGADLTLNEEDIALIEQGKLKPGIDFEKVVAEPAFMPKLAKIARILGPRGMMPNPKTGTVSENLEKVVTELKKGKVEVRNETNAPIIHTRIGKVSFENDALKENFLEILKTLKANKPQKVQPTWIKSCFLSATMGPSIPVIIE